MAYAAFSTKVAVRIVLDKLEIQLRNLFVNRLNERFGNDWWDTKVPKHILKKCSYWKKNHINDPFRIGEVKETYQYMSFGHLINILDSNKEVFDDLVNASSVTHLYKLVDLRDALSHPTEIQLFDIVSCTAALRGITEQINTHSKVAELMEEFHRAINQTQLTKVHNLPTPLYSEFVGRKTDIEFIDTELLYHPNTWILLIDGIGGIGKSSLAYEVAKNVVDEIEQGVSEFQQVIWISAKSNKLSYNFEIEDMEPDFENLEMLLDNILDFFQINYNNELSIVDKRQIVQESLEITKCLMVFDNLETISDVSIYSFFDRIPSHNKILLTSRDRRYKLLEGKALPLKGLEDEEAIELINSKILKNNIEPLIGADYEVLKKIAEVSYGHPLILDCLLHQIYLGRPVEQVLSEVENTELVKVFDFCFGSTYNQIGQESQKLLMCMVLFDKEVTIKELSFVCNLTDYHITEAIERLKRFSLVQEKYSKESSLFSLLPIINNYVSYQMSERKILVTEILQRFELYQKEMSSIDSLTVENNPLLKSFNFSNDFDKLAAAIANSALNEYNHTGDYNQVVEALNSAMTLSPKSSFVCQIRALVEKSEGFFGESAKWYDRATSHDSKNALLWRLWGDLEKGFPNFPKAMEKYSEAVDCDKNDHRAWMGLGYCQNQTAREFYERQNYDSHMKFRLLADESFTNAIILNPTSKAEKIHNVKVYHQKGSNLFHIGEIQGALNCCEKGFEFDKYNKQLLSLREKALRRK
ncbi:tetratricopeptide repeat protein [Paenibacillus paridis]|uniref:tetratricopeptide repeat protein n=1 Tax=Paenibacillus paridis TaxID=2583376 RepID=UPI00112348D4|nr:NB-ARC domain-containing protein [Paenibacillus paridis]